MSWRQSIRRRSSLGRLRRLLTCGVASTATGSSLTVIDIFSDDIRDHRYRLWGSLLANATETEMTGRRMADNWGEVNDASTYTDADLEFLKVMRKGENIGLYMGPIDGQFPGVRTLLTLRLPLSSNGGTVDRVMSATRITIPEETWRPTITADRQRNL